MENGIRVGKIIPPMGGVIDSTFFPMKTHGQVPCVILGNVDATARRVLCPSHQLNVVGEGSIGPTTANVVLRPFPDLGQCRAPSPLDSLHVGLAFIAPPLFVERKGLL